MVLFLVAPAPVVVAVFALSHGWTGFAAILAFVVAVFGILALLALYWRTSNALPEGAMWAGYASLRLTDVRNAGLADQVQVKSERRLRFWTHGLYAIGSRLEVRPDELRWTIGRFARLLGVRGTIRIPWTDVRSVEIGHVPGTLRGFGGGLAVQFEDGRCLDGNFLGSSEALRAALRQSPLGDHT